MVSGFGARWLQVTGILVRASSVVALLAVRGVRVAVVTDHGHFWDRASSQVLSFTMGKCHTTLHQTDLLRSRGCGAKNQFRLQFTQRSELKRRQVTPPLQRLWIELQWGLGWVEFHPASEVYKATI